MSALISRNASSRASETLDAFPALIIEGARQVGKSTFAQMLAADRVARILTLDDPNTLAAARRDPHGFVNQFSAGTLVIDEVQRAPELILPIKASIDQDRRPGRFLLTGSSDLLKLERTPDSLAGRAIRMPLGAFSQGERAGTREDFVGRLLGGELDPWAVQSAVSRQAYIDLLAHGGYPELQKISPRQRTLWIDGYVRSITQRDIVDIHRPVNPDRLLSVLRLLATNQSGELVKARLADAVQIPATSITMYLDLLSVLFLVDVLPAWTPNLGKRETGRPKVSVTDSALAMRLARVTPASLEPLVGSEYLGPLLEGLVTSELRKQATWSGVDFDLYHYRHRDQTEVDVVIELDDGRIIGLEVKAHQTYKPEHFRGLSRLAERLGERFALGVVLGTSHAGMRYTDRLWGLPIASIWEL